MKTISIDIPDKLYDSFKQFVSSFNSKEIKVYTDDANTLTVKEEKEVYKLKAKSDNGDYSDFDYWDEIKKSL